MYNQIQSYLTNNTEHYLLNLLIIKHTLCTYIYNMFHYISNFVNLISEPPMPIKVYKVLMYDENSDKRIDLTDNFNNCKALYISKIVLPPVAKKIFFFSLESNSNK